MNEDYSLLRQALQSFLQIRRKELATGPLDTIVIPVKGQPGDVLEIPALFLETGESAG